MKQVEGVQQTGLYAYFQPVSRSMGPVVEVDGKELVMAGSNDYLGLTHDPRVVERAKDAIDRWGTGPGGSRFLSGNMTLHDELEERLAAFVGKKKAVVHTTGFLTNLGSIKSLMQPDDLILFDKENHASIMEGCKASRARITYFAHNDAAEAHRRLASAMEKYPEASAFLITEGVFSMSGDVAVLDQLVKLKEDFPELIVYLDDAHGLGVMGSHGRGTANHFGVTDKVDFIMGTFSKAMASIGGFIASDNEDVLAFLRNDSKTLIFSAALPAASAAAVIQCIDILEKEPERVERLWEVNRKVRKGLKEIGLCVDDNDSPIIPIYVGSELKAMKISRELFARGVFALPAVYPAVPWNHALIRTAFMSTHEDKHIEKVLDALSDVARKYGICKQDVDSEGAMTSPEQPGGTPPTAP